MTRHINVEKFSKWGDTGIRAQLVDKRSMTLVDDFIVEGDKNSVHILNAVLLHLLAVCIRRLDCGEVFIEYNSVVWQFDRFANDYSNYNQIQREIAKELVSKIKREIYRVADIGSGNGAVIRSLALKISSLRHFMLWISLQRCLKIT